MREAFLQQILRTRMIFKGAFAVSCLQSTLICTGVDLRGTGIRILSGLGRGLQRPTPSTSYNLVSLTMMWSAQWLYSWDSEGDFEVRVEKIEVGVVGRNPGCTCNSRKESAADGFGREIYRVRQAMTEIVGARDFVGDQNDCSLCNQVG